MLKRKRVRNVADYLRGKVNSCVFAARRRAVMASRALFRLWQRWGSLAPIRRGANEASNLSFHLSIDSPPLVFSRRTSPSLLIPTQERTRPTDRETPCCRLSSTFFAHDHILTVRLSCGIASPPKADTPALFPSETSRPSRDEGLAPDATFSASQPTGSAFCA